jgi:protein-tyrosine-phosphatase
MAEFFCRKFLSEKLNCNIDKTEQMGYKVTSAGVMDAMGFGATREVVEICRQKGIDATNHRNRTLTTEQIEQNDYIYVMGPGHRDRILELCPAAASKCCLLDENVAVADPIGGDIEVYKTCAQHIEKALIIRISEIWHEDSDSK